ncbi:MAG TPA: 2-dehydropantoate 2-reductase [Solirubrobacteraceae bacterium]|nr:2-dehydropantoate 2-reductase [Solirubrobacteraceae bacterium]
MAKFAVLGAGAVGGFLSAALNYRSAHVTVVGTERSASYIRIHGLHLSSATLGDFSTRPRAVQELEEQTDVLFIAVRATELDAALARIKVAPRLIIPLTSGLEHLERLRERFPNTLVCAASMRVDAEKKATGDIVHRSSFAVIDTAFDDDWVSHRELRPLVEQLKTAGIALLVSASESQVLWSRMVFLNALSLTSALANMPVGWIRKDPEWRRRLQAALEEGAHVALGECGTKISVDMTMEYVDHANYQLGSVMQRDIQAGRQPELDAIAGSVLRAARRLGVECPTIADLTAQVAARAGVPAPRW